MEVLHLTYREAVHEIPFRNLVLMQKDKMHEVIGHDEHDEDQVEYKGARDNPKFKKMIK